MTAPEKKSARPSLPGQEPETQLPSRKYPRVQIDYSKSVSITDQSSAVELTMESIVRKIEMGIQPQLASGLIYSTDLGIRNLQDVMEHQQHVENLFFKLPMEVRDLMGQDFKNFEQVIADPKNRETLLKHDLIVEKRDQHVELIKAIQGIAPKEPDQAQDSSKK